MAKLPLFEVSAEQQTLELQNYILVSRASQLLTNQIILMTLDQ
jgi:hypothetical protein